MKNLGFSYEMKLTFDIPVREHHFTIRCIPRSDARQEITDLRVEIFPNEFLEDGEDSFGNLCIFGYASGPHDHFSIRVEGKARAGIRDRICAGAPHAVGMYKVQTDYTRPGGAIRDFAAQLPPRGGASNLERATAFMDRLYESFRYVQGATSLYTTAEEAMERGEGVCQDYAHILLSLCRMERIPCRYVVGLLMGEGLSHAWVEVYEEGYWIALDPTNHLVVDDAHIRISSGRDYADCTINQGIFTGQTTQTQEAAVSVYEIEGAEEHAS